MNRIVGASTQGSMELTASFDPRGRLAIPQVAQLFGLSVSEVLTWITNERPRQEFLSIAELASLWRCSRATVYNRLRSVGAVVLDFAPRTKRGGKAIALGTVLEIERRQTKRLL